MAKKIVQKIAFAGIIGLTSLASPNTVKGQIKEETGKEIHLEEKCKDPELAITDGQNIYIFNYINGEYTNVQTITEYAQNARISNVRINDITGDGKNDLIIVKLDREKNIHLDTWSYNVKELNKINSLKMGTNQRTVATLISFQVGDTDGDGKQNDIAVSNLLSRKQGSLYKYDGDTVLLVGEKIAHIENFDTVEIGDITGDKNNEIIYSSRKQDIRKAELDTVYGRLQRTIDLYSFINGEYELIARTWGSDKILSGQFDHLSLGDIDGDGDKEIVGSGSTKRIEVFDYKNDSLKLIYVGDTLGGNVQTNTCGDFDGDGIDEIIAVCAGKVRMYKQLNGEIKEIWSDKPYGKGSLLGSASSGDIDGDGIDEFIFGVKDERYSLEGDKFTAIVGLYKYDGKTWNNVFTYDKVKSMSVIKTAIGDLDNK